MTVETLKSRIASFPYWYHRIPLAPGLTTPGWAPINPASYGVPERLDGLRILDVGAWDGYWTFEALRRGAAEVVAIDDFSDHLGSLSLGARKAWGTFDLCREALGIDHQRCKREEMSVYDITAAKLGSFDVVFFFGTIYHLRHPLLALDKLSTVCRSQIFVESAILDDYSPYRGGLARGYPGGAMVMEFYPGTEYGNNASNWWVPTLHCLGHMVRAAGFTASVEAWKLEAVPMKLPNCRGFVRGAK
jgi:tRNA (mo5U34)-methyltransferase